MPGYQKAALASIALALASMLALIFYMGWEGFHLFAMTQLLALIHVLAAIGHGYTCWPESHATWLEWLCQKP